MPYSFTKIEKDKSNIIGFVFSFLIIFYFFTAWIIVCCVKNYLAASAVEQYGGHLTITPLGWSDTLIVLIVSILLAVGHWLLTINNLLTKICKTIGAKDIDPNDTYHAKFKNVVDEVNVATGGGEKIIPVVVPSVSMNAFALADFEGRSVIGVTEGVLSRLTRSQLEAVVAHEAAHIVSGDCLATTVTSSMFELYGSALKGMEILLRGGRYGRRSYRSSGRGGGAMVLILLVYLVLYLMRMMSYLLSMFISRQREYRADAIATRLTRNPLALAEALTQIAYRWRGAGMSAQEMEAIFIMNPKLSKLDDSSSSLANLFSTHPPVKKRISVLLNMAHTDVDTLITEVEKQDTKPRVSPDQLKKVSEKFMVQKDGKWEGPFDLVHLLTLGWLRPDMWIKKLGENQVKLATDEPEIRASFDGQATGGKYTCPKCRVSLHKIKYEGTDVYRCSTCVGILAHDQDVQKILMRREVGFSESIVRMANTMLEEQKKGIRRPPTKQPPDLYPSPDRSNKGGRMLRSFYSATYPVEVDKCIHSNMTWFDKDELELLQCMVEKHSKPKKLSGA